MSVLYSNQTADACLFAEADAFYATIKENLSSPDMEGKTGAEVERQLAAEQQELMRRLFQAHLTLRGQGQVQEVVGGADGIARPHRRQGLSRQLETVFGTVEFERTGHAGRNLSTLYPVDAGLNAPGGKYSHEVDRQIAKAAARLSFDEALEMVCSQTGAHLPKRQAEEAVQRAARDFDEFYSGTSLEFDGPTSEFLVLTLDQKGVVLHQQDLAEATRQAAQNSRWKMDTRLSPGEKRGRKRMATLRKLTAEERKPVDKAAAYLLRRSRWGMMRYDQLLSMGAPIATGIIEGACRHLINDRMDRTGARWRLLSAEAVLRIRSLLSSGDFDEYWQFHEEAEAHRHHVSKFAGGKVPPVKRPTRRPRLRLVRNVD